jgi:uncharacterized membrane protein YccC
MRHTDLAGWTRGLDGPLAPHSPTSLYVFDEPARRRHGASVLGHPCGKKNPVIRIRQAAQVRDAVVPTWLMEVTRFRRVPVPWENMIRAALAICVPLAVAVAAGQRALGLLIAMGGLMGTIVDRGGPYLARLKRVCSAALFGGAAGLGVGSFVHDRGWLAVLVMVIVAGVSALMSAISGTWSVTGLYLLIYASLGLGPLGAVRPWWHTALGFLIGVLWALVLIVPGWVAAPRAAEQRSVAAVYRALAALVDAAGTPRFAESRRSLAADFNSAYDTVLAARSAAAGGDAEMGRLMALLNQATLLAEAAVALNQERNRAPQPVIATLSMAANAISLGQRPPIAAQQWESSPGAIALSNSLNVVVRLISPAGAARAASPPPKRRLRDHFLAVNERVSGELSRTFALRLMASIGVAVVMSEVLPLQRSYWVVLTVAIVLKPDFGSVFARALQRGAGTVIGAVLGAVILVTVPYGPWLLIPFGVIAALLPYGLSRNYGLFATFVTPLIVLLIDLLVPGGWQLALSRLLDTLLGCAIVLLVGYAPWPTSWQVQLPGHFARTIRAVSRYLDEALTTARESGPGASGHEDTDLSSRSQLRRQTYRALSDLRAEFQRTMSEPAVVSRRASAWWPALVGLEQVVDAVTASAVAIGRGARAPAPAAVRQLSTVLAAVADQVEGAACRPSELTLPSDEPLRPVTEAVRPVLGVLGGRDRPAPAPVTH